MAIQQVIQNRFNMAVPPTQPQISNITPVSAFTPQTGLGQTQIQPAAGGVIDAGFNPPPPKGGFPVQVTGGNIQQSPVATGNVQQPIDGAAQQPQQPQQQFGLSGFESALGQGFTGASQAINAGAINAVNTLGGDFSANAIGVNPFAGGGAFQQGANALSGGFGASASNVDPLTGQPLFQQAASGVNQFTGAGVQAQQQQAALSGALGPEAQQQAINAFNASPGQAFLREQGELGIINQATALGGTQGGNVLRELQRQGIGLAQQDFANQFDRLGQLSGQGLQAAGQAGQFLSQAGQQQGNLAATNAQLGTQASIASAANALGAAQGQANLFGQAGQQQGQIAQQNAQLGTQVNLSNAANRFSAAGQQAGLQNQQGVNIGNLFQSTAGNVGQARLQAGRDIAQQIGGATSALSGLQNQQGTGLSNLLGGSASNIANLLSQSGQFTAQQQAQLAQLLANSATGQGTQLANIAQNLGLSQNQLALQGGQDTNAFLENLLASSTTALGG